MRRLPLFVALFAGAIGPALAQQAAPTLTAAQDEGRRLFVQHCNLCHWKIQINVAAPFGPLITRAVLEGGKEAQIKAQIANGSPNMPGYKVMFEPAQIDAIVEYIKTVNPPAAPANR
jgi:mono/diheme cytochrome c family protein